MVEPRVYQALSQPIVGHLDPYFFEVAGVVRELLRNTFGTKNELTIPISGTGSSGMETAVANFVEPGAKFAVFANGYFCDRLSEMGRREGADVVRFEKPWGDVFSADEASEFVGRVKPDVVGFVHAETSTGALQPPKPICDAAHEAGAIVIADTVTSLGAVPVNVDENGIDIAYSCTQKGLSCPPGLAPITVSRRALEEASKRARLRSATGTWTSTFCATITTATSITTPPPPRCSTDYARGCERSRTKDSIIGTTVIARRTKSWCAGSPISALRCTCRRLTASRT